MTILSSTYILSNILAINRAPARKGLTGKCKNKKKFQIYFFCPVDQKLGGNKRKKVIFNFRFTSVNPFRADVRYNEHLLSGGRSPPAELFYALDVFLLAEIDRAEIVPCTKVKMKLGFRIGAEKLMFKD